MSIYKLNLNTYVQKLNTDPINKLKYGEVHTDFSLIQKMLELIPDKIYKNPNFKWLDPGAGYGYFSMLVYFKLIRTLKKVLPDFDKRHNHIISNMLFMVEINPQYSTYITEMFGTQCNFINDDFLTSNKYNNFDIIIGNPPFNSEGLKKVPTNTELKKRHDGKTIWADFIKKAVSLLKPNGLLLFIVPSIWMKPDRGHVYDYMLQYKIHKIHCFSNTYTNKLFRGEAQTPSCYFLLEKTPTDKKVLLYDIDTKNYNKFVLRERTPIPVFGSSIINRIIPFTEKYGNLSIIKTNMPNKKIKFNETKTDSYPYPNIHTCIMKSNQPCLSVNYSNIQCPFYNNTKLVLAHGMYGFPYIDEHKFYGISNRDKYVYLDDNIKNLEIIRDFLSTKFAIYLFESTRYRMKYLEKYIFQLIPNIINIPDFPSIINDDSIADFFKLTLYDRENIQKLHKKNYSFFK